jgi:hypothetical protein
MLSMIQNRLGAPRARAFSSLFLSAVMMCWSTFTRTLPTSDSAFRGGLPGCILRSSSLSCTLDVPAIHRKAFFLDFHAP